MQSLLETTRAGAWAEGDLIRVALEHQMIENDRTPIARMNGELLQKIRRRPPGTSGSRRLRARPPSTTRRGRPQPRNRDPRPQNPLGIGERNLYAS